MKVRCHCSAPPSHPPSARAVGQSRRSFCGIFAPKLGKARKICSPLPTITNSETAFTQWQRRTRNGCSYTACVTSPVFTSSIAIARVPIVNSWGLQAIEFGVPLIFPIADLLHYTAHFKVRDVLCLLVADLGGDAQTERSAVFAGQRLAVHFVTEQRLRVHGGGDVNRLVIVIRAFDADEAGGRVGANHPEEVRETYTTEAPNHIPSFDADMASVLGELGKALNLGQSVISRLLYQARHGEGTLVEIHFGVIDVVAVNGELFEGGQVNVGKRGRQVAGAEQSCRHPIAKGEATLEKWLLQLRNGKGAQHYHGRESQQLTPADGFELAAIGS